MKHKFSEEIKETYLPFWEEMKEEFDARPMLSVSPELLAELQSILNRAYMRALEVGFNEGMGFQINKTTKK
ncbi:MAG TPA: hypothetical protein PLQ84_09670 [Bacteroidales bacterium]|jgi:hypothetical protein|nr:hypothetical protein [Bacteroidales bacterium]HOG67719.1 hypothetical protein [Bacteroidales bacterium]HPW67572.1 hypothetical protein [Salinivirgaceae bacterium]